MSQCVSVCVLVTNTFKTKMECSIPTKWINTEKTWGSRVRTGLQGRKKKYNVPLCLSHVAQRLYIPMPPSPGKALVLPDEEEARMHSMVQQTGWEKDRDSEHARFASMPWGGEMNLHADGSGSGGGSNHIEGGEKIIKTVSV